MRPGIQGSGLAIGFAMGIGLSPCAALAQSTDQNGARTPAAAVG
jgi:hypothetical protein